MSDESSGTKHRTSKDEKFNPVECELRREAITQSIQNLDRKVDIEVGNFNSQLDRVERNLFDAIKQANRVSELASNGHRDTLNSTLQSIYENFERGTERFRTNENLTAKMGNELDTLFEDLQKIRLDLQFLVTNREDLQALLNNSLSHIHAVEGLKKDVEKDLIKVNKHIYKLGMLFIIGYILMAVYESSGHDIKAAWETLIKIIF